MDAQHLSRTVSTGRQIRRGYVGAGVVLAFAVVIGTIGGHILPTQSQAIETPLAGGAPAPARSTSEMPRASVIPQSADLSDTIYVVRSSRQALALRHSQPE